MQFAKHALDNFVLDKASFGLFCIYLCFVVTQYFVDLYEISDRSFYIYLEQDLSVYHR